jgi:thiol:disulfide interchange protein DsbG
MVKLKTTLILILLTAMITAVITREAVQSRTVVSEPNALLTEPPISSALANAVDPANIDRATQLIAKVSHGEVSAVTHFSAGGSLIGFVIQEKGKNEPSGILYTDSTGSLIISANHIVNQEGHNILERDFSRYIQPEQAFHAYQGIHKTAFLEQGKSDAPHKMYIMLDPNCPHCHTAYMSLQEPIQAGNLAVRWILVGNITPTSQGKALAILGADDPLQALNDNEVNFDLKAHSGGITPIDNPSLLATSKLKLNMDFVITNKLAYTPTFFFKTSEGLIKLLPGALSGDKLTSAIQSASSEY